MSIFTDILARPPFIIAEAGVNHNGDLSTAKRLVDVAVEAGAGAVKFQTFKAEKVTISSSAKAEYQLATTDPDESQFAMLKRLELSEETHREIINYCYKKKILFLSTPFDAGSADLLEELGVPIFKIPSGEITNLPLVEHIAKKGKPLIISTGMATLDDVRDIMEVVSGAGNREVVLLHCVSEYPAPVDQVNLRAMITLRDTFEVPVGFSDHTLGIEVAIAAVALGAQVIEKHFTLDKGMQGPDHRASLEPHELREMVHRLRNVAIALGDGIKKPAPCEEKIALIARRSLVASREIKNGKVIDQEDIDIKRPGQGIPPKELAKVLGKKAGTIILKDELISWKKLV